VPVLADWDATRPGAPRAKEPADVLRDWFTSVLVLSANFRFRPARGQRYYLYCRQGEWSLSLIGPREWSGRAPGACLGRCELQGDMTWTLEPREDLADQPELLREVDERLRSFLESLDGDASLEEALPGYRRDLPYFQRMLATGLGASLRGSVRGGWSLGAPARQFLDAAGKESLRLGPPVL